MGRFVFMILMAVPEEIEDKFNRLYDGDHLPYMMQVPGNMQCDRYRLDWSDNEDMLEYLAIYEIASPDLPFSAEWKRQAACGAWPTEMRPLVKARRNGVFREIASHRSDGRSGVSHPAVQHIYFLQQSIPAELDQRFNHLYDTDHVPLMMRTPGVNGCTRYRLERSESGDVPDYLAIYDIDGPDVPRSAAWKAQTNKGAWPTEMRPHFTARRNGSYTRISHHAGRPA